MQVIKDFKDFISGLLPTFGRDRILEDLRVTKGDLSSLIAPYQEAAVSLKNHKPVSEEVKELYGVFKRNVGSDNPIVHISQHLPEILANVDMAEKLVVDYMSTNVAGAGLTLKQANVVRFCDALYLVSKYARKFLLFVYTFESAQYESLSTLDPKDSFPPAETRWMRSTMLDFCRAYMSVCGRASELEEQFSTIPDVEVAKTDSAASSALMSTAKADPRRLNFIATKANPIYFVRMAIAEWQVRRYKAAKEELAALQLRMYHFQKLQKNQADAKIEQKIAYLESRIQELNFDIAQMEKDVA